MPTSKVIQCLRSAELLDEQVDLSDGQLLESYINHRSTAAIEALIRRHGPMVWGVCRRILRNPHDVEDAYQTTFLVLVRKAISIARRDLVGNWLYGVARQTALKARALLAVRKTREIQKAEMNERTVIEKDTWDDLELVLDQELGLLPDKYRTVIVLCDLEGKTRQEAAACLRCPEGTVGSRLARARSILAKRLSRRGLAVSGMTLSVFLAEKAASSIVPAVIQASTIKAAALFASRPALNSKAISPNIAALTERVMKTMLLDKLKVIALPLAFAFAAIGAGSFLWLTGVVAQDSHPFLESTSEAPSNGNQKAERKLELVLQTGHTGSIESATYSPDGKCILTTGNDHAAIIWDAENGRQLRTLKGHTSGVYSAEYSPDSKRIVSASRDTEVIVWDADSGLKLKAINASGLNLWSVGFIQDGKIIIGKSGTDSIIWDAGTGEILKNFKGKFADCTQDGKRLITIDENSWALVWDVDTGKLRFKIGAVKNSIVFNPAGTMIYSSSGNFGIIWDAESGEQIKALENLIATTVACFSPDGKHLVTGSFDNSATIWDLDTGKSLHTLLAHNNNVLRVGYSPNGKQIITGSADGTSVVWDAESGKKLHTFTGWVEAIDPDGKRMITYMYSARMIWDFKSGERLRMIESHSSELNSASFSPNEKRILTASDDGKAVIWDGDAGLPARVFEGNSASYSQDGKRIVTATQNNTIVWDAKTGRKFRMLKGTAAQFSPDRKRIATISNSDAAIWDAETGEKIFDLKGHSQKINSLCFSPDGKRIVTASNDHSVIVWDADTGKKLRIREGHSSSILSASYSPDGKRIVTASADKTAVGDGDTGILEGHTGSVNSACYSPDGKSVVTASSDNTAIIWDASSGQKLLTLQGHTSSVNSASYNSDGKQIITASADGTTRLWDAETGRELCLLSIFDEGKDWLVIAPGGFFDGSPGGRQKVAFRTDGKLDVVRGERFAKEFYRPGLLANIWKGNRAEPGTPGDK